MAKTQSHFAWSTLFGLAYAGLGLVTLHLHPEHVLLGAVLLVVGGMLPNIDADPGAGQARELGGLFAAIIPLVMLQFFPQIRDGGIARIALVVICFYVLSHYIFVHYFERWTKHRGFIHSIPTAVITLQVTYLIFRDLYMKERLYISLAVFLGFMSHLFIDGLGNVDWTGKPSKKTPVLKLAAESWESTVLAYSAIAVLGWIILRDIYPHFRVATTGTY
jgi:membrane-bound metal-dependent hydrolase YbcI (DUF457 family)